MTNRTLGRAAAGHLAPAIVAAGCKQSAPPKPPPSEVPVITVASQPTANVVELPGRLQAIRIADVRARVDGIVERRVYTGSTDVRAGQPLFEIDPRQLRAHLNAAEAALARAEMTAANAAEDVALYIPLGGGIVERR